MIEYGYVQTCCFSKCNLSLQRSTEVDIFGLTGRNLASGAGQTGITQGGDKALRADDSARASFLDVGHFMKYTYELYPSCCHAQAPDILAFADEQEQHILVL